MGREKRCTLRLLPIHGIPTKNQPSLYFRNKNEPLSKNPGWIRRLTMLEYAITSPFPLQRKPPHI